MKTDRFLRDADGNVLAVVTLVIASLLGTVGLTMGDEPLDTTGWSAVSTAHAGAAASNDARVARDGVLQIKPAEDATNIHATEVWNADESAQGTRSEAAH